MKVEEDKSVPPTIKKSDSSKKVPPKIKSVLKIFAVTLSCIALTLMFTVLFYWYIGSNGYFQNAVNAEAANHALDEGTFLEDQYQKISEEFSTYTTGGDIPAGTLSPVLENVLTYDRFKVDAHAYIDCLYATMGCMDFKLDSEFTTPFQDNIARLITESFINNEGNLTDASAESIKNLSIQLLQRYKEYVYQPSFFVFSQGVEMVTDQLNSYKKYFNICLAIFAFLLLLHIIFNRKNLFYAFAPVLGGLISICATLKIATVYSISRVTDSPAPMVYLHEQLFASADQLYAYILAAAILSVIVYFIGIVISAKRK
jgi:hypothetical protein